MIYIYFVIKQCDIVYKLYIELPNNLHREQNKLNHWYIILCKNNKV